jgi:cyclic pyranopterin phosphate synthase
VFGKEKRAVLVDGIGRNLTYLRVSVTENCNLACTYCLPEGRAQFTPHEAFLSAGDFVRLVSVFARLGIERVRLTGGEPLLRKDILEIARGVRQLEGIRQVHLSTNGVLLARMAAPLREAGVSGVNVSIDTLDPDTFHRMAGADYLDRVLDGLAAAIDAGMDPVKINTVILRGVNEGDIERVADLAARLPVVVRFIELMPTGANHGFQPERIVSNDEIRARLLAGGGWSEMTLEERGGPARYYSRGAGRGIVGFVSPLSHNFCDRCNRLRLTARGELRMCLFSEENVPLAHHLRERDWAERVEAALLAALRDKPPSHYLGEGRWGNMVSFVSVGG